VNEFLTFKIVACCEIFSIKGKTTIINKKYESQKQEKREIFLFTNRIKYIEMGVRMSVFFDEVVTYCDWNLLGG
jgi:hypothetical protein